MPGPTNKELKAFKRSQGVVTPSDPIMGSWVMKILGRVMGLHLMDRLYLRGLMNDKGEGFLNALLKTMGVTYEIHEGDLSRIPREGPVVVVANHPYGGLEGLILCQILQSVRPDIKVMANYLLGYVRELKPYFILVDPFETSSAIAANIGPLRESLGWLKDDGLLGVFPSGEVSHITWTKWEVTDPPWPDMIGRLVQKSKATVVPLYFTGRNSNLFQAAGLVHPMLRTAMLPREMLKGLNRAYDVRIGLPIPYDKSRRFADPHDMVRYYRWRTYLLGNRADGPRIATRPETETPPPVKRTPGLLPKDLLTRELQSLPSEQRLLDLGEYSVYRAFADQIPNLLQEIGHLREMTFREVGEGTGKELDLDVFDRYYIHLFIWNNTENEVVGGYRLGQADRILKERGIQGMYTHTLFHYNHRFLARINPALELGRSFIRPEYQRSYNALMLLWKGIGAIVAENPQYKILFGPVSITREYDPVSRQLMANFLKENKSRNHLARLVRPRNPLKTGGTRRKRELKTPLSLLQDVQQLNDMIMDIEEEQKGLPILLKQYTKLGGQSLAFNVDRDFSDCLDSLILVDLTKTDRRILERYMGKNGTTALMRHHGKEIIADCA